MAASILALAEKNKEFADLAKEIIMGYVQRYSEYPERNFGNWTWGKLNATGLQEAVWMAQCARVCRFLIAGGWLTEADMNEIRNKMFVPAIALLRRQTSQVHNIHVWYASAIFAMAILSKLPDDIMFAEKIIRLNLEKGVLKDGSWFEGSPHYHFYTLEALIQYALACQDAGRKIVIPERIPKMFNAPIQLLLSDRTFPLLNDGWESHTLTSRANIYEIGQYLFGGFEEILATIYHECGLKRTSKEAFVYGPDKILPVKLELKPIAVVDGVAVVRRGETTCLIKANPFGGSHDHPDKPGLYLFKEGCPLKASDIGNCGYGSPMFKKFYRITIAHNTIMVDKQEQTLANATIVSVRHTPKLTIAQARSDKAYKGVTIQRTVSVSDGWIIDWCRCKSSQEHLYTWLFHVNGIFQFHNHVTLETAKLPIIPNKYVTSQQIVKGILSEIMGYWSERDEGKNRLYVQLWNIPTESENDMNDNRLFAIAESPDLPAKQKRSLLISEARGRNVDVIAFFSWGNNNGTPTFVVKNMKKVLMS